MTTKTGIRVVRGPDWSDGNDDGGEGHLGTVTGIPGQGASHGMVQVVWDSVGEEKSYFAGKDNKFELRIYDSGPIGMSAGLCDIYIVFLFVFLCVSGIILHDISFCNKLYRHTWI